MKTPHADTAEQRDALLASLDAFTQAYIECALWSSWGDEPDGSVGPPLNQNYGPEDLSLKSLQGAIKDCAAFQEECANELEAAAEKAAESGFKYNADMAGHDFWLTRNGHGAGFWDRGLGDIGERLNKAAKSYGTLVLVVTNGVVESL